MIARGNTAPADKLDGWLGTAVAFGIAIAHFLVLGFVAGRDLLLAFGSALLGLVVLAILWIFLGFLDKFRARMFDREWQRLSGTKRFPIVLVLYVLAFILASRLDAFGAGESAMAMVYVMGTEVVSTVVLFLAPVIVFSVAATLLWRRLWKRRLGRTVVILVGVAAILLEMVLSEMLDWGFFGWVVMLLLLYLWFSTIWFGLGRGWWVGVSGPGWLTAVVTVSIAAVEGLTIGLQLLF